MRVDPLLQIDTELAGSIAVVRVGGEIDLSTAPQLTDGIDKALVSSPTAVVVDLSAVTFLASIGMNALISAQRKADVAVVVVADGPNTRRPMELVGMSVLIPIFADVASAIESLTGDAPEADPESRPLTA